MTDTTNPQDGGVDDAPSLTDEEMLASEYVPHVAATTEQNVVEPVTEPTQVTDPVEPTQPVETPAEVNPLTDDEVLKGKPAAVIEPEQKKEEVNPAQTAAVETTEAKPVDHKAFYDLMMTPFKANGKTIELRSPEEAIQLMQQGANYTRKMQDIAVHKKHLTMLENNGLLDEDKLAYLIDLDKKNPEAIKKLIKESGIDPLEIDVNAPAAYTAGNHKVSDDEVKFRTVLDAVGATPEGKETLQVMNTGWDQASKDALWSQPDVMEVIHEQRLSGVYQQVADEIERQRILGTIKPGTPFLDAYRSVGNFMGERGMLKGVAQKQTASAAPAPVAPVATKVAAPKSAVTNNQQVAAAAVTRTGGKRTPAVANLANLSDDAFMQQFAGRL